MTNVRPTHTAASYDYPPAPRRAKWSRRNIALLIIIALAAFLGSWGIYSLVTHSSNNLKAQAQVTTDSGVQACQTMATSINRDHALGANAPHSDAELATAVKPFNSSQYADLRTAGTNALTAILNVNKAVADDNTSFGDTLALYSKAQVQWGVLQVSCNNHGATLPALPDSSKS